METKTADSSVNDELNDEQFNSVLENIAFVGDSVTLGYGGISKGGNGRCYCGAMRRTVKYKGFYL